MPKLFDTRAKMHDIVLSNFVLLGGVAVVFNLWEAILIIAVVVSPILYSLAAMWSMFTHPVAQRSLWNRYGK